MPNAPRRSYRRDVTEERAGTLSVPHFSSAGARWVHE